MTDNPYSSPRGESPASHLPGGVDPALADELRSVSNYQRAIQYCILTQFACYIAGMATNASGSVTAPSPGAPVSIVLIILGIAMILAAVAGVVFAVLLALRVYNVGMAVFFGFVALIPCAGLLALLVINQRATARLQEFQIPVGLLGADMQAVEERIQQMQQFGAHPPGAIPAGMSLPKPPGPSA